MVFGLFGRKQEPKPVVPDPVQQLRTPSPSVLSGSSPRADERVPPITPSPPPAATDAASLRALLQSIPAQTLRNYTLNHLTTASPQTLAELSIFFSALEVPVTLHCVRCHKGYFDVENNDRACLVAHDDESAEVEGIGSNQETLWNCCGKTVEGDGSEGPPEGWCFEGAHTTDLKRARFRADSSLHDDKLVSCARRRCHEPPGTRKRTRRAVANSDSESDSDDDGASHSSIRTRSRASKRVRRTAHDDETDVGEDVEMPASPKSTASKRKPRAKSVVSNTATKPKSTKSRSVVASSDSSPTRSKKPPSTRFLPVAASFTSTVSVNGSAGTLSQTETLQVIASSSQAKAAKAPAKRTMKPRQPKQPKRLDEAVESSIVGEI